MFKFLSILLFVVVTLTANAKEYNINSFKIISNGFVSKKIIQFRKQKGVKDDICIALFKLKKYINISKISAKIYVNGFKKIDYLAIGSYVNNRFEHIKIRHFIQGRYVYIDFDLNSLAYKIQNKFKQKYSLIRSNNFRIFIKGKVANNGAQLKVKDIKISDENDAIYIKDKTLQNTTRKELLKFRPPKKITNYLLEYDKEHYPSWMENAKFTLEQGGIVLLKKYNYKVYFNYNNLESLKEKISFNDSLRYSYNALHHINFLLIYSETYNDLATFMAARSLAELYLQKNFFEKSKDMKYAWYDHGVAERQMILLRLWNLSLKYKCDKIFLSKLLYVLKKQAELLNSEFFYARNQNYRYHNHAIFQDISLLLSSKYLFFFKESHIWYKTAKWRIMDQLQHLLIKDKGYYISTENSSGYHMGLSQIVLFLLKILQVSNDDNDNYILKIRKIYNGMIAFTKLISYANGQLPAIGDTYRTPCSKQVYSRNAIKKFVSLNKAGYSVAIGNNYKFIYANTSLNKTHKHKDNLSFVLYYDGLEWIIDPSFYSYEYKEQLPAYLRSEKAHNHLVINNKKCIYVLNATKTNSKFNDANKTFIIVGNDSSYKNCIITRKIKGLLYKLHLEFTDSVNCKFDNPDSSLLFQFAEHVIPSIKDNIIILKSNISKKKIKIIFENKNINIKLFKGSKNPYFGYAGTTFLKKTKIYTAVVNIKQASIIKWKIVDE